MLKRLSEKNFLMLSVVLVLLAVGIAYSNTYKASFHFDDQHTIVENPRIKHLGEIPSFFWTSEGPVGTRPLLLATLALNYAVDGLNVVGYHIFNNLLHAANGILLFLIIMRTLDLPALRERHAEARREIALFGALLFVVHPVQTEAVTYIISRSMPMATFFYLLGLLLFERAANTGKRAYRVLLVVVSFLGMASREDFITFPVMLFLYDAMLMSSFREAARKWRLYAILGITVAYRLWLSLTHTGGEAAGFGVKLLTPFEYLMTQFNVLWTYVRLLFLPINQNLDYDYPIAHSLFGFPTILSFVGHLLVIAFAVYVWRKSRLATFLISWWYITISPASSFVPLIDVIFEHRVYLPSIGFFFLFMLGYERAFAFFGKVFARRRPVDAS
jgi:hypothetical protein